MLDSMAFLWKRLQYAAQQCMKQWDKYLLMWHFSSGIGLRPVVLPSPLASASAGDK